MEPKSMFPEILSAAWKHQDRALATSVIRQYMPLRLAAAAVNLSV